MHGLLQGYWTVAVIEYCQITYRHACMGLECRAIESVLELRILSNS